MPGSELSERDRSILAFEEQRFTYQGAKDQAIRDTFGLSATTYYQILARLLDDERALAYKPLVVRRLRRLRSTRFRAHGSPEQGSS
ncbi:MAG: DUF3263 domain-containing protein [Micrococcaceae bacterium]